MNKDAIEEFIRLKKYDRKKTGGKEMALILRRSIKDFINIIIIVIIGRIISLIEAAEHYRKLRLDDSGYKCHNARATNDEIERCKELWKHYIATYKTEQLNCDDIEKMSEYYIYGRIEKDNPSSVCNIGCFYCGADQRFLQKNSKCKVYALDIGDIVALNKNITQENLLLYPGYPLETLEKLYKENVRFDYAIMTRTATIINIEQLLSYMAVLSKMARNIIFLEVGKLTVYPYLYLDVNKIDMMKPVRMYGGMYIHNYTKILKMSGYEIAEEKILPYDTFKQFFTPDHDFIYVHGRKAKL